MIDVRITAAIRARLASLETSAGQLTPAMVLADAKNPESPLHALFDWNLETAAAKYWLLQARAIIRRIRIVETVDAATVAAPYYLRDPSVGADTQGYVSLAALRRDPAQALASLQVEFRRAAGALARAQSLAAVVGLGDELDVLLERLLGLRHLLEERTVAAEARPS